MASVYVAMRPRFRSPSSSEEAIPTKEVHIYFPDMASNTLEAGSAFLQTFRIRSTILPVKIPRKEHYPFQLLR